MNHRIALCPALASLACLFAAGTLPAAEAPSREPVRLALGGAAPAVETEEDLRRFVNDLEAQRFLLSNALNLETYHQWLGRTQHLAAEYTRFTNDLLARRDYAAVLARWRNRVTDPALARRVELLHRDFLQAQVDPALVRELGDARVALQDRVGALRLEFGGEKLTPTAVGEHFRTDPDRARRREAFLARNQLSAAHGDAILACMRLHDRVSRAQGFANGAEAGLAPQGLTVAEVIRALEAFEEDTRPVFEAAMARARSDLGVAQLEPWDLSYWLHRQELAGGTDAWPRESGVPRLRELMAALGFKPEQLPIDVAVRDVPTGGVAFFIRPGFEARLLTNPFSGSEFYATLFHEYGHTLHAVLMDPALPPGFLADDGGAITEGIAETLGHFAYDAHWLERAAKVTPSQAARLESVGRMQLLLWLRQAIAINAYFELLAYRDLDADLDQLYAQAYRRFMRMELPPGRYYGAIDMFATAPTYLTSYVYANMIATQLREAMRTEFGVIDLTQEPRVGPWLTRHFLAPGRSVAWPEMIRQATGRPLDTVALKRYLEGARQD